MPVKTIYLDVPAELGLERVNERRRAADRLDSEGIAFHVAVCEGYRKVVESASDRMVVIDASKPLDTVIAESLAAVREILDGD